MTSKPSSHDELSQEQRALLTIRRLRERVHTLEDAARAPIAIVGMGCRFPGGIDDPEAYWRALLEQRELVGDIPRTRWDRDAFYDADPDAAGKMNTRRGGFVRDVESFDASFFGLTTREAERLDPQQRLLLEVSWEALENAGWSATMLERGKLGVFVGISTSDSFHLQTERPELADAYTAMGTDPSFAAGRLAYFLNTHGPCMSVNTLCSSSLVALHLAVQSLRSGECERALVAGVNVMLWPHQSALTASFRALSADGRCKAFDASADGYVRSEGCGVIALRRLHDAQRDGDRVVAVVRGSAINHDGRSLGMAAPNGAQQSAVIAAALRDAGLAQEASSIGYVETHGTGTALGDPIEVAALAEHYGAPAAELRCLLGAVKTNLGHLEAAAGIASLIKAALVLERGQVPANLHLRELNPRIELAGTRFELPGGTRVLGGQGPRRAGVSSFGMSGTNAHVLLEQAPSPGPQPAPAAGPQLFVISAKTPGALRAQAARCAATLADVGMSDLAHTLACGRTHFAHRAAIVASAPVELERALNGIVVGASLDGLAVIAERPPSAPRMVWLFAEPPPEAVAAYLRAHEPRFASVWERCPPGAEGFATQCVLIALMREYGCEPAAVLGHGAGECAAAYASGALSLEDAARAYLGAAARDLSWSTPTVPYFSSRAECELTDLARNWSAPAPASLPRARTWGALGEKHSFLGFGPHGGLLHDTRSWYELPTPTVDVANGILRTIGALHCAGVKLELTRRSVRRAIALPTYPFERTHCYPAHLVADRTQSSVSAHRVEWRATLRASDTEPRVGRWLVLADRGLASRVLADVLAQRGCQVELLEREQVASYALEHEEPIAGVVSLWGLDRVDDQAKLACDTIALIQALAARTPVLWSVTHAGQAAAPHEAVASAQAALWGLLRGARGELTDRLLGALDVDAASLECCQELADELLFGSRSEPEVTLRAGLRATPRLVRDDECVLALPPCRADGAYLITGGTGALGLHTAEWLVERGARSLWLVSRSAGKLSATTRERIGALEARGCTVRCLAAYVSDSVALSSLFARIEASGEPLRGIVHAAGTATPASLAEIGTETMRDMIAVKAGAARALCELSAGQPLDFILFYSSLAAVLGANRLAHYAAANHALDAVAREAVRAGRPALSLQWGPWAEGGLGDAAQLQAAKRAGILPFSSANAFAALERRGRAGACSLLASIDWRRCADAHQHATGRGLFAELAPPTRAAVGDGSFAATLRTLSPAEASRRLMQRLRARLTEIAGGDASAFPEERGFFDLGFDSLMAVDLRDKLTVDLGLQLPPTVALEHPSLRQLHEHLLGLSGFAAQAQPAPRARGVIDEPIAIVGMGCRFPGGADSAQTFWELLLAARDATGEATDGRWAEAGLGERRGGYLRDVRGFDAGFFGISKREARSMDPQQRLLLEVVWEALEHGGVNPSTLRNSEVGVFVGAGPNDYGRRPLEQFDASYFGTGNAMSVLAGRIAHVLGVSGPALSIDTACSSSLVAVHLACRALRGGECELALAGGVNLLLAEDGFRALRAAGMLAPDGRCKTFGAQADGYGRGEGAGMIALRRLSEAEARGERIYAVIRGSGVNHNGPGGGLTVPSGAAQSKLIRDVLLRAGVSANEVSFVEAHGTGTALGDPIEVNALRDALRASSDEPLLVGSVKTNLGHLEAAAGIAGLIKATLALHHGVIPASLHAEALNPALDWEASPVKVARTPQALREGPHVAGVSSFGFSGTNAHVLLGNAPSATRVRPASRRQLLKVSAPDATRLAALCCAWSLHLRDHPEDFADLAETSRSGRSDFEERLCFVVQDAESAQAALHHYGEYGLRVEGRSFSGRARGVPEIELALGDDALREVFSGLARLAPARLASLELGEWSTDPGFALALQEGLIAFLRELGVEVAGMHGSSALQADAKRLLITLDPAAPANADCAVDMEALIALLYVRGARIDWTKLAVPHTRRIALAGTGFEREPVWVEESARTAPKPTPSNRTTGRKLELATSALVFELTLHPDQQTFLRDHTVHGRVVVPGSFYVSWLLGTLAEQHANVGATVSEVSFERPLALAEQGSTAQLVLHREGAQDGTFEVHSRVNGEHDAVWVRHARGRWSVGSPPAALWTPPDVTEWQLQTGSELYRAIGDRDLGLGPNFRWIAELTRKPGQALAELRPLAADDAWRAYRMFPGLLDSWWQVMAGTAEPDPEQILIPIELGRLISFGSADQPRLIAYAKVREASADQVIGDLVLARPGGELVAKLERLVVRRAARTAFLAQFAVGSSAQSFRLEWRPAPPVLAASEVHDKWCVIGAGTLAHAVADGLTLHGVEPHRARFTADCTATFDLLAQRGIEEVAIVIEAGAPEQDHVDYAIEVTAQLCRWFAAGSAHPHLQWTVLCARGPALESAWGVGRTARLELGERALRLIEVSEPVPSSALVRELREFTTEEVRLAANSREVPVLRRIANDAMPFAAKASGVYVITGGLGALGLETAAWLASRGARCIALLGRGEPLLDARTKIEALARQGARAIALQVDVADERQLAEALAALRREYGQIVGVVHAAGTLADALIHNVSSAQIERSFAGKVRGAHNLDRCTATDPLHLFVSYSSVAAQFGNAGQAAYAAANGGLDALMQERSQRGVVALNVHWGPWRGAGMAAGLEQAGALDARQAFVALEGALAQAVPQATVMALTAEHVPASLRRAPLLRGVLGDVPGAHDKRQLLDGPPAALLDYLRGVVAQVLGEADIDVDEPLTGLGMDSLRAVEIRNRIEREVGVSLASSSLLAGPSVRELANGFGADGAAEPIRFEEGEL